MCNQGLTLDCYIQCWVSWTLEPSQSELWADFVNRINWFIETVRFRQITSLKGWIWNRILPFSGWKTVSDKKKYVQIHNSLLIKEYRQKVPRLPSSGEIRQMMDTLLSHEATGEEWQWSKWRWLVMWYWLHSECSRPMSRLLSY